MAAINLEDTREKVRRLLRELFQFDLQNLDFGIYRILNFKRKEIERFIDKDLVEAIETEFKEYAKAGVADLQKEVEELKININRDFGEGTIEEHGRVMKHQDAPKIKQYLRMVEGLKNAEVFEVQMNEIFNHVYEFFSRYYDKGDFISKSRYGAREKYYIPYNGEEVTFYWANKDQYYAKTAEYFKNYHFKVGGYRINFLLREAEVDVNNVVGKNKYFVLCDPDFIKVDEENKIVDIYFEWRALTDEEQKKFVKQNVQDTLVTDATERIFSKIRNSDVSNRLLAKENGEKTVLEKHLNNYVRRNTSDYFIHKNLKAFLKRELEFYIKNEIVDLNDLENLDERSLHITRSKVKAIHEISQKIIDFLAQIEDFQKMLFEKKKLIIKTEYIITLDKIKEYADVEFLENIVGEILNNTRQLEEWKELLGIQVESKKDLMNKLTIEGKDWKKFPLDTRYFDISFKTRLLEALSGRNDLDKILDGTLIKSENWQALNLILNRFKEKVQSVFIDPPFNTGTNEFLYKNNYLDSSWISMTYDRVKIGKKMLKPEGSFLVRIDYHGNMYVRLLMNEIFGEENFRNEIIVNKSVRMKTQGKKFPSWYDSIFYYSKNIENVNFHHITEERQKEEWRAIDMEGEKLDIIPQDMIRLFSPENIKHEDGNPVSRARIILGKEVLPRLGRHFPPQELITQLENDGKIRFSNSGNPQMVKPPEIYLTDDWTGFYGYSFNWGFPTENSEILLKRVIEFTSNEGDLVMDFFLGSGTTAAVAHKLGRKWIGVEMGQYFDNIPLKRMKAVLAGEQSGITKEVDWEGGGFFKYHYVEQYEDTLDNIVFIEKDKTIQETLEGFQDYFLRYMLDYETKDSPTRLNVKKFQMPFDYKIWVIFNGERKLETVDLIETFNYLLGIDVEKFRSFNNGREYHVVFGKRKDETIAIIWRNSKDIDLKVDKEFVEKTILAGTKPDRVFINGDSLVERTEPIEPEFKRLMGV